MKLLDLFCGMGGWSVGFHRKGYECYGVDTVDVGYPYRFIKADIRLWYPRKYFSQGTTLDVIIASPPCTEFSPLTKLSWRKGQRGPPHPEKGMELVKAAMRIISQENPEYWILENVKGAIPYISKLPHLGEPTVKVGPYCLWGNFPRLDFEGHLSKNGDRVGLPEDSYRDPLRSWKRARIPIELSSAMARTVIT